MSDERLQEFVQFGAEIKEAARERPHARSWVTSRPWRWRKSALASGTADHSRCGTPTTFATPLTTPVTSPTTRPTTPPTTPPTTAPIGPAIC
jgi:hypothetical protein